MSCKGVFHRRRLWNVAVHLWPVNETHFPETGTSKLMSPASTLPTVANGGRLAPSSPVSAKDRHQPGCAMPVIVYSFPAGTGMGESAAGL